MRVLVVGSGGREHALAWKIAQSPLVTALFAAPGNPGIGRLATLAPVRADDVDGLTALARQQRIDLVVVGPEAPLVAGLVDRLSAAGILAFGPTAAAAEIEGSKAFAKEVMASAGIPTAAYAAFTEPGPALEWSRAYAGQVVVKADGLAAGKGVVVCSGLEEVERALREILIDRIHGQAGARVIVEEKLTGPEASCICLTDGAVVRMLPAAQDHKRIFDGDRGPNTGGMGAFCPTPKVTPELLAEIQRTVLVPAVREMARRGRLFRGALYAGLMLTPRGPRVLEFNARLGDPETQPILLRVRSDLLPLLAAAARGQLGDLPLDLDSRASVGVVLAAEGYPGRVTTGDVIRGADAAFAPDILVFHAATAADPQGRLVTAGGRVITVCALGSGLDDAARRAYGAVAQVGFRGMQFRKDIGASA
jgi:phosphoribosylamine--glycine ligase